MSRIQTTNATSQRKQRTLSGKKCLKKIQTKSDIVVKLFDSAEDYRIEQCETYTIFEVFLSIFVGVLHGEKDYYRIEGICRSKISELRNFSPFSNGIPPFYVMHKIMEIMDPKQVEYIFVIVMSKVCNSLKDEQMKIDKEIESMIDRYSKHMMSSTYVCGDYIMIAQETVEEGDDVADISELLEFLKLKGATISIDESCLRSKAIDSIIGNDCDYVVYLNDVHNNVYNDVQLLIQKAEPDNEYIEVAKQTGKK